jgi:hypothetical protein
MQNFSKTGRWFAYHERYNDAPAPEGVDPEHTLLDDNSDYCIHRVTMTPERASEIKGNTDGVEILGGGWSLFPETRDYLVTEL